MSNSRTYAKEILRWSGVALFGGFGLWLLFGAWYGVVAVGKVSWFGALFGILCPAVMATPFLAAGYLFLYRQYRKLLVVLGWVGGMAIFFAGISLPEQLGLYKIAHRGNPEIDDYGFLSFPLVLLSLLGPYYAAGWFYRFCHEWAYPGTVEKTQATRWLVWSGIGLVVAGAVLAGCGLLAGALTVAKPPLQLSPAGSPAGVLRWGAGVSAIGALLLFLGLVRRTPLLSWRKRLVAAREAAGDPPQL
jgi:hypothetical protein